MPKFKTIPNDDLNELAFCSNYKGRGKATTERMFQDLMKGFARRSNKYIHVTNEAPFAYKERQLNSLIVPSLDEISDAILMEHPVQRKYDRRSHNIDEHHGYIDCWFSIKNQQFVMELKHSFENLNTDRITQDTISIYQTGLTQIDTGRRDLKSMWHFKEGKGTIPILIHVIALRARSKDFHSKIRDDLNSSVESYAQLFSNAESNFPFRPELVGYWSLPNKSFTKSIWYDEEGLVTFYPGVIFLGQTAALIQ